MCSVLTWVWGVRGLHGAGGGGHLASREVMDAGWQEGEVTRSRHESVSGWFPC